MAKGRSANHHRVRKGEWVKVRTKGAFDALYYGKFIEPNDKVCLIETALGKHRIKWSKVSQFSRINASTALQLYEEGLISENPFKAKEKKMAKTEVVRVGVRKGRWTEAELGEIISRLVQGQKPEYISAQVGRDFTQIYVWRNYLNGTQMPQRAHERVPRQFKDHFKNIEPPVTITEDKEPAPAAHEMVMQKDIIEDISPTGLVKVLDEAIDEVMSIAEDITKMREALIAINDLNDVFGRANRIGGVVADIQKQITARIGGERK